MAAQLQDLVQYYKGRSYVFVNQLEATLSELQCPICQEILLNPLQTTCGHLFCKHCLLEALQRRPRDCPLCRQRHSYMKDAFNHRKIGNLQVKCPNHAKGCTWVGILSNAEDHASTGCELETVACPKGCDSEMLRKDITEHVQEHCQYRTYTCQYCGKEGQFIRIVGHHLRRCKLLPLSCPNECGETKIPRYNMPKHAKICPYEVVRCEYHLLGCPAKMQRCLYAQHIQESKDAHLDYAMTQVVRLTKKVAKLNDLVRQAIPDLEDRVMDLEISQEPRPHSHRHFVSDNASQYTTTNMEVISPPSEEEDTVLLRSNSPQSDTY